MSEQAKHEHVWRWNGYHFLLNKWAVLHYVCDCGEKMETDTSMSDWWYQQAYNIWQYEQRHPGYLDKPESEEER